MRSTVFLGGGRITSALVAGLLLAGDRKSIVVYDRNPPKLRRLQKLYGVRTERDLHRALKDAKFLIIAVRPNSLKNLLRETGEVDHPLVAISLVAGVPVTKLRNRLGAHVRWCRAMPSPASRNGRGLTALAFDRKMKLSDRRKVKGLFAKIGPVIEIPESKFDAFTVTYSASHGYHALSTLARGGEKIGLDREIALLAAAHALADGIIAWREGKTSLDELLNEAATPGGIAAAVMRSLDAAGYKRAVQRALVAGLKRTRSNAGLI